MIEQRPRPAPWYADAPVGGVGIGAGIAGAALAAALEIPEWIAALIGIALGLVAQVAINNLICLINERVRRRILPRVAVDTRDDVVVIRVSYTPQHFCEAEMSPEGAMQLARALVGSAVDLDADSEHRVGLQ